MFAKVSWIHCCSLTFCDVPWCSMRFLDVPWHSQILQDEYEQQELSNNCHNVCDNTISSVYTWASKKLNDFEMEAFSLTLNISAKSLSNLTTKDSFWILKMSWFWNWPWLFDLIKNWRRYWGLKRRLPIHGRMNVPWGG